eukprot:TRINITY_DN28097_c0_g1_i3.p2 TRINITY_DN28097_c0_g1~~TRINITY_DN28097_c0_g1_i3.p2  ORF type:complete len:227 (-),score=48.42 TRINITY_DN28097_c0_g1_i3:81-761(-)
MAGEGGCGAGVSVALNPIEKRRQRIAQQLLATNPARLARSKRRQLMGDAAAAAAAATAPVTPRLPESGAPPSPTGCRGRDASITCNGSDIAAAQVGAAREEALLFGATLAAASAERPSALSQDAAADVAAALLAGDLSSLGLGASTGMHRGASPRKQLLLEPLRKLSERDGVSREGDRLMLKELPDSLSDDPLEVACGAGLQQGAGFSMAAPPPEPQGWFRPRPRT